MDVLLAFGGALVALRLTAELLGRWRERRAPELLIWAGSLGSFALASGALAWGAAAGWDDRAFRAYYLFGGLLTAALLGLGSLRRAGVRLAGPAALVWTGLAVGVAIAVPLLDPSRGARSRTRPTTSRSSLHGCSRSSATRVGRSWPSQWRSGGSGDGRWATG